MFVFIELIFLGKKTMFYRCAIFASILLSTDGIKNQVPYKDLDENLQVITANGVIQGISEKTENGFRFFSFLGIPYARPPLGNLRFRAPEPFPKWSGVLDARISGNCCAGLDLKELSSLNFQYDDGEEDCLYLNIYTPSLPQVNYPQRLKPVMVWIYGGAYLSGCADKTLYGPDYLIVHDVLLVTVNYRLTFFGGLSTEDEECPGNWNIRDQIASLKWVQKNIAKFGGDPTRVTLVGQSAGAASVNFIMLSPQAKDLFQAVILESGSAICCWTNQKHSRQMAFDVGYASGIKTNSSKELLAHLRGLTSLQLKEAQIGPSIMGLLQMSNNGLPFTPVVEHTKHGVLIENSFEALDKGHYHKVPVLMGTNSLEFLFFDKFMRVLFNIRALVDITPSILSRNIENPEYRFKVGRKIRSFFTKSNSFEKATLLEMNQLLTSDFYTRPLSKTAALMAKHNPVYFYRLTYDGWLGLEVLRYITGLKAKAVPGVAHAEEIIYLFKTNATPPLERLPPKDLSMIKKLTKLWTNFAKYRNPTPESDPLLERAIWPTVSTSQPPFVKNYVEIGEKVIPHYQNFVEAEVSFWESIYEKYRKKPYISF